MEIKLGTRYVTESGHPVRIYAIYKVGFSAAHGAFLTPQGWEICEWNPLGRAPFFLKKDGDLDLTVAIKEPKGV